MYVISPWSRGGWVNSQVFDHTSAGQFLEKRFGVTIPAISPWHRAVCGDLTSAFDFATPNADSFPALPKVADSTTIIASIAQRPKPDPPATPEALFQESGLRRSRALPYELHVQARVEPRASTIALTFNNTGRIGVVFHVYDQLRREHIPRRYTVEAAKSIEDEWPLAFDDGRYDLCVYAPNGFVREFRGIAPASNRALPEVSLKYQPRNLSVEVTTTNLGNEVVTLVLEANVYHPMVPNSLSLPPGHQKTLEYSVLPSHNWYDLSFRAENFHRRYAGRMETGNHGVSDPAI